MTDKQIKILLWYSLGIRNSEEFKRILQFSSNGYDLYKVEKDFVLTAVLHRISKEIPNIYFKGWTCLNKIYFPFFCLSEDLDFTMQYQSSENARVKYADAIRDKLKQLCDTLWWWFNHRHGRYVQHTLMGHKKDTQLMYTFSYKSIWDNKPATIKVEITSMAEIKYGYDTKPILANFKDPIYEQLLFPIQQINCITLPEMIAEKCRAALTRHTPAIRDFYDLWYISQHGYNVSDYISIIKEKCEEDGNRRTIDNALPILQNQIQTELYPVINLPTDFDLMEICEKLVSMRNDFLLWERE